MSANTNPWLELTKPSVMLRQGRQAIEKYGWHQGSLGSMETGFCAMGAVRHVQPVPRYQVRALEFVALALGFTDWRVIPTWNDADATSKTQVLDAFIHAEKLALGAENAAK